MAGKVLVVLKTARCRPSDSLSARTIIGSGLHFFQIGSSRLVGVSLRIRIFIPDAEPKMPIVQGNDFQSLAAPDGAAQARRRRPPAGSAVMPSGSTPTGRRTAPVPLERRQFAERAQPYGHVH